MLGFSVEAGTLDWYAKALGEGLYLQVFWNTFEIALLVTAICLLLGYPLGFLIATTTPLWATLGFIFVLLPLWTSVLVRTYAWMVLLGRNGVFNRWLIEAGVISDPLPLLHNFNGVLIGMVHVLLPYMVLPIYGAVRRLDPALVAAAEGLGASTWRIFWRIYLPLTLPGIFAGRGDRLRAVARLLHHPGAAGRRQGDDGRRDDRAGSPPDAELALRRGPLGRAAGADARRL